MNAVILHRHGYHHSFKMAITEMYSLLFRVHSQRRYGESHRTGSAGLLKYVGLVEDLGWVIAQFVGDQENLQRWRLS